MSDIHTDYSAILADFAKQTLGSEPAVVEPVVPGIPAVPEPVVPVVEPVAVIPTEPPAPVVEPVVQTPTPVEPIVEPSVFSDWDADSTPAPVVTPAAPEAVFVELSKVLGTDIKSQEDAIRTIQTLKAEAEKAKGPDVTQIRPELLKAIELDQKGGDYAEYLKVTSVDYSTADPVQLYEDYVIDSLADAQGNVDTEKVNEFLDGLPEYEKELRGKDLQKRLIYEQQRKVADIEREAVAKREKHDTELKSALRGLGEIDGFKVDDKHRAEVFNWIASGKMMKDLFYDQSGQLDPMKTARNAFRALYYEKLDSYQKSKIRNTTKREIMQDLTNPQITTPAIPSNPIQKRGYDIGDYINDLESKLGK